MRLTATCRTAVQHGGLPAIRNPGCILYVSITRQFSSAVILRVIDLSNGVGFGVGIVIGLGLRNISEGCFKTLKVNKYKSRTVYRAMLGYGI